MNEYYGVATTPTTDYLAHYGIKGMKWGVRKAIERGGRRGERALGRQYLKAQKKLAKLEKRALSGRKYAKRAALLGAGAAAAGGLAATGTGGINAAMNAGGGALAGAGRGVSALGESFRGSRNKHLRNVGMALDTAGRGMTRGGHVVEGAGNSVGAWGKGRVDVGKGIHQMATKAGYAEYGNKIHKRLNKLTGDGAVSRNTLVRAGAAGVGLGLAGAAGYNAYRAATTKRAAAKAANFRKEMNKTFAGTKFANGVQAPQPRQKRRRR